MYQRVLNTNYIMDSEVLLGRVLFGKDGWGGGMNRTEQKRTSLNNLRDENMSFAYLYQKIVCIHRKIALKKTGFL